MFTRISNFARARRTVRVGRYPATSITPRSTGDHHNTEARRSGIGNNPRRYAANTVPGAKSAPPATTSLSPATLTGGKSHNEGAGSTGTPTS
ncbi:hypothetical protein GCM10009534_04740 [Kribbella sandramycini]